LLTLVVLPVLYSWVAEIKQRRQQGMYDRESDLQRNNQFNEKIQ
jgi:hypothetical protein